jgi:hypothetical protein
MSDPEPTETVDTTAAVPSGPRRAKRWQKIVSVVLLVVGFILVPLSAIAIWAHNQLTNTDRYVETVSPLAENKDIQQAVARRVVNALFENADAPQRVESALPERAKFLGGPLANAMRTYATTITEKVLASEQFDTLWDEANRRAHGQLVALLTDDPSKAHGAVTLDEGKVQLNIGNVVKRVQQRLVAAGLTFLQNVDVPPVATTIDIINTEGLAEARGYLEVLDTLAWVLPVLLIACFVAAALVVPTRRRATIRAALVLTAACAFTLVLLAIGRSLYLDAAASPNVSKPAASAVFDILVRNLRYGLIVLGVIGIVIALVAYFVGPSPPAKKARALATSGISGARRKAGDLGYQSNPVEVWVAAHRRGLELAVAGLAVLALVLWDRPGLGAVLFLVVVALILVGFIEFLARGATPEAVEEPTAV